MSKSLNDSVYSLKEESQKSLDKNGIISLNTNIVTPKHNNNDVLIFGLDEMKGNYYQTTDVFYETIQRYRFLTLDVIYDTIVQEARTLQRNEVFMYLINDYYNEHFIKCLFNYYNNSPQFFQKLFPNKINGISLHQFYQKYYYLCCIIQYVHENEHSDEMKSLPLDVYKNIVDWCITRYDPNILFQIEGPLSNQLISFDFKEHYETLINVQNTTSNINDYNKLVKLQNINDNAANLLLALLNRDNSFVKNPDLAREYNIHVDGYYLQKKYITNDNLLIYDLSYINYGDTTNDRSKARIEDIDKLSAKDVTLSKLNIKQLEQLFNMYSRVKISSLTVDKNTYITNLSGLTKVTIVFDGVQCSDRSINNNENPLFSGNLIIQGTFKENDKGQYYFVPFSEYTTYRRNRTRVKKCDMYLFSGEGSTNVIIPYELQFDISATDFYNIPIKYNSTNNKGIYVITLHTKDNYKPTKQNEILYLMYDSTTKLVNLNKLYNKIDDYSIKNMFSTPYTFNTELRKYNDNNTYAVVDDITTVGNDFYMLWYEQKYIAEWNIPVTTGPKMFTYNTPLTYDHIEKGTMLTYYNVKLYYDVIGDKKIFTRLTYNIPFSDYSVQISMKNNYKDIISKNSNYDVNDILETTLYYEHIATTYPLQNDFDARMYNYYYNTRIDFENTNHTLITKTQKKAKRIQHWFIYKIDNKYHNFIQINDLYTFHYNNLSNSEIRLFSNMVNMKYYLLRDNGYFKKNRYVFLKFEKNDSIIKIYMFAEVNYNPGDELFTGIPFLTININDLTITIDKTDYVVTKIITDNLLYSNPILCDNLLYHNFTRNDIINNILKTSLYEIDDDNIFNIIDGGYIDLNEALEYPYAYSYVMANKFIENCYLTIDNTTTYMNNAIVEIYFENTILNAKIRIRSTDDEIDIPVTLTLETNDLIISYNEMTYVTTIEQYLIQKGVTTTDFSFNDSTINDKIIMGKYELKNGIAIISDENVLTNKLEDYKNAVFERCSSFIRPKHPSIDSDTLTPNTALIMCTTDVTYTTNVMTNIYTYIYFLKTPHTDENGDKYFLLDPLASISNIFLINEDTIPDIIKNIENYNNMYIAYDNTINKYILITKYNDDTYNAIILEYNTFVNYYNNMIFVTYTLTYSTDTLCSEINSLIFKVRSYKHHIYIDDAKLYEKKIVTPFYSNKMENVENNNININFTINDKIKQPYSTKPNYLYKMLYNNKKYNIPAYYTTKNISQNNNEVTIKDDKETTLLQSKLFNNFYELYNVPENYNIPFGTVNMKYNKSDINMSLTFN